MWTQNIKVIKVTDTQEKRQLDRLIYVTDWDLILNNKKVKSFSTLPKDKKSIAIGFLVSTKQLDINKPYTIKENDSDILSIGIEIEKKEIKKKHEKAIKIPAHHIFKLSAKLQENALLFKDTAITESAAIATEDTLEIFGEDISRLTAIDKVIGLAIQKNIPLENKILLTSGKIDKKVVQKALATGITGIISRTAPTHSAYELCKEYNICLIGFSRGKRANYYL